MDLDKLKKGFEKRFRKFISIEDVRFHMKAGKHISELHYKIDGWDDEVFPEESSVYIKLKQTPTKLAGINMDLFEKWMDKKYDEPKFKLMEFSSEEEENKFLKSKGIAKQKINLYAIGD
jgi:hypothetical protein